MKNRVVVILICFFVLASVIVAEDIQLINFGNLPGREPSIEKKFNQELGLRLATVQGMQTMDEDKSDNLKRRSDFVNRPTLTRKLIESLREAADEKSLLVWSEISHLSVTPKRKWIFGAEAFGEMTVKLYLYSLYFGEYIYSGELKSEASKAKSPVFFRNVEKITHIKPQERIELSEKMSNDILSQIEDLVISIARSELTKSGVLLPQEVKKERAPSVSDMFNIPSVEAPEIDE